MPTQEDIALSRLEKVYKDKITFYQEKLRAIGVLKSGDDEASAHSQSSGNKKFDVPELYDVNFGQDAKVYFALRSISGGYATDVAAELIRLDKGINPSKAKEMATQKLSKLKGLGHVNHTKVGLKYKYWI